MKEEKELHYEDFLKAKKSEYWKEVYNIIRNITFNKNDINSKNILSKEFFERTDISKKKMELLKLKTMNIKKY